MMKQMEKDYKEIKKGISTIDIINDYCVIDIETTGLDSKYDEIIKLLINTQI
jgi:DNA polymerase III alpha subunit (gram-positive type)